MPFAEEICCKLKDKFTLFVDRENSHHGFIVLRSTISTAESANLFVTELEKTFNLKYTVYYKKNEPKRKMFSKSWLCQHNGRCKTENSTRNAHCKSRIRIIIKKVNRFTKRNDKILAKDPSLACQIEIKSIHSHPVEDESFLRLLRVSPETKQKFYSYFDSGLTPCEARTFHLSQVLENGGTETDLANSSTNPTETQIYYMNNCWKKENLGPVIDPFDKLKERVRFYEEQGCIMRMNLVHPWAIVIVTPVMARVQRLQASKELIYLVSSNSEGTTNHTVTTMLAATKAGAIPIAFFIHEGKTAKSYISAFSLLRNYFPLAFAGSLEGPRIFMTEDAATEKKALSEVFPSSVQLLSQLQLSQAHWHWLQSLKNTTLEDKKYLMKLFLQVMSSDTLEKLEKAVTDIELDEELSPHFQQKISEYMERKEECVEYFRKPLITKNHSTYEFSEASIRAVKGIILLRNKVLNVVSLADYFVTVWDTYLSSNLSKYAHGQAPKNFIPYYSLLKKMLSYSDADVIRTGDNSYLVPSEKSGDPIHLVDVSLGICSCLIGQMGGFCKHQCFLYDALQLEFANAPSLTITDRYLLAKLALGEKCRSLSFFASLTVKLEEKKQSVLDE